MKIQQIFENEEISLDKESIIVAYKMKALNSNLPFTIEDNRLIFDDYTVGSVQILNNVINILPRNPVFSLNTIFEMILFNNDITLHNDDTVGYDYIDKNGVSVIPNYFYNLCKKLVDYGITGDFIKSPTVSKNINGELILEKFNYNIIKTEGIHYINQTYILDIPPNQLIKSALLRVVQSSLEKNNLNELHLLLREFDAVQEYSGNTIDYQYNNSTFFSCNPYYPETIQIALTILNDIKLSFSNGSIQWYSFLQNSNNLFETYVRKLVARTTNMKIEKWKIPVKYASLSHSGKTGYKSYSPDILVEYNASIGGARVVLDVKNKKFNPLNKNISELINAADMYQMLFYCRKLKTNLGGLLYPTSDNYEPINVIIDDDADRRLVLFSVNMSSSYKERLKKLKEDLHKSLFKYI